MNQGFKLRFDQMRESDPTPTASASEPVGAEFYPQAGYTRNLCLVWPTDRRFFLNYAYLVAAEFEPASEYNLIRLNFTSHQVSIQGYCLENLFMALLDHLPRLIRAIDPRYVLEEDKLDPVVIEIRVETKDS